jgi:hypothetical protein
VGASALTLINKDFVYSVLMITIHGTFENSSIISTDGQVTKAYPFGIDYPKINGKTGWFQLRQSEGDVVNNYLVIINWILDDETLIPT